MIGVFLAVFFTVMFVLGWLFMTVYVASMAATDWGSIAIAIPLFAVLMGLITAVASR